MRPLALLGHLCACCTGMLVLTVLLQVANRPLATLGVMPPLAWTEELSGVLLGWTALSGAVLLHAARGHLAIDLLLARHQGAWRRRMRLLVVGAEVTFIVGILGFGGARLAWIAWELDQRMPLLGWPRAAVYLALPLAALAMLAIAWSHVRDIRNGREERPASDPAAAP